jgi:hypothetical protein
MIEELEGQIKEIMYNWCICSCNCRIYYHSIKGEYEKYSGRKYRNNNDIQPSLLYKDFEKGD